MENIKKIGEIQEEDFDREKDVEKILDELDEIYGLYGIVDMDDENKANEIKKKIVELKYDRELIFSLVEDKYI